MEHVLQVVLDVVELFEIHFSQWTFSLLVLYKSNLLSLFYIGRYGNANVWKIFTDLFDYFPLTALVCTLNLLRGHAYFVFDFDYRTYI